MMHKPSKADVLRIAGEPVAWIAQGHLREVSNGNVLNCYCAPEKDRFADEPLYTEAQLLAMYAAGAEWKEAVLDHCTVAYSAFYEDDPKKTLDVLIDWHVKVALDPQVSSDAQALINKGAEAMREQVLRGLRSEDDSQQLRAIIASIVALPSTPTNEGEQG